MSNSLAEALAQRARESRTTLTLALKREYFEAVASGAKREEFRLATPFWRRRLEGRRYGRLVLTLGYPSAGDAARRIELPWRGVRETVVSHPHFGPDPVAAYAILLADGTARTIRREELPKSGWHACPTCRGAGSVETVRDLHRSAGTIPCPHPHCHAGTIRSRTVEYPKI